MISKANALTTLSSFIDYNSPKLATFLYRNWNQQQNAITYRELREAIFAGQLDVKYLAQWQQDYSDFVANYYTPLAEKAIKDAAATLANAYGGALEDPLSTAVDSFIKTQGGKLIKELSTAQYSAINTLVRQASLTETMTVDQLARVIRPCVGLTQRQAQTVRNYYDTMVAQGYSPKAARKKQAVYAAKVHMRRAATIAQTEMAFAYNHGMDAVVRDNISNGIYEQGVTKKWRTSYDENVCDICGKIDGEEVSIDDTFGNGYALPPGHPNCRCAVSYHNIKLVQPQPQQAVTAPQAQPQPTPTIADAPDLTNLQYLSSNQLGTSEMHQYKDASGNEWLFKPAQSKGGQPEQFRAYVQEAGYKVQSIIDPDSAIPCGTVTLDTPMGTKFGAAQLKITGIDPNFDLKSWQWQYSGATLDPDIVAQLQRENVTDWLLGNYDCHGGNFILRSDGKLIGVDKEQAFRYINHAQAQSMDYNIHPNAGYGETEPIYNTLYRRFANGEIDIKLNDTLAYIKRIEAVPDADYREIFREYAESLHGKGAKAEQLLDQIVTRKQNIRATFETFYSDILTQRKGKTTVFQFADNAVSAVTQSSPITNTFTPATLKAMKITDLYALAKTQGIKNYSIMHKDELVAVISDPSKLPQVYQTAMDRAKQQQAARAARRISQASGNQFGGVPQLSDALKDIDGTLKGSTPKGVALISDEKALEGMGTVLRKITIDGEEYYELSGKMMQGRWEQAVKAMRNQNMGSSWSWNQAVGAIDYTQPVLHLSSTTAQFALDTLYIQNGDDTLVIADSGAAYGGRAFMGAFDVRVKASNGADAAQRIRDLMQQAGMMDIADDATAAALDRYKKMRVIWQTAPSEAAVLDVATASDQQIDNVLKKLGITQRRLDAIEVRKVTDGYWTLYDPENVALANRCGAAYLYHEAGSIDAAVNVLSSGELLATTNRYGRGIFANGASSFADMRTGGADNVFTRIVFDNQFGEYRYGCFGDYVFVFDTKALERTDWYAYTGDMFGTTEESIFNARHGTEEHFLASRSYYRSGNELLFRKSLPMDTLKEVRVPSHKRQDMIDMLHARGISQINGIRVEDLIKDGGNTL